VPTDCTRNIFCKPKVTSVATTRDFEVMSHKLTIQNLHCFKASELNSSCHIKTLPKTFLARCRCLHKNALPTLSLFLDTGTMIYTLASR